MCNSLYCTPDLQISCLSLSLSLCAHSVCTYPCHSTRASHAIMGPIYLWDNLQGCQLGVVQSASTESLIRFPVIHEKCMSVTFLGAFVTNFALIASHAVAQNAKDFFPFTGAVLLFLGKTWFSTVYWSVSLLSKFYKCFWKQNYIYLCHQPWGKEGKKAREQLMPAAWKTERQKAWKSNWVNSRVNW